MCSYRTIYLHRTDEHSKLVLAEHGGWLVGDIDDIITVRVLTSKYMSAIAALQLNNPITVTIFLTTTEFNMLINAVKMSDIDREYNRIAVLSNLPINETSIISRPPREYTHRQIAKYYITQVMLGSITSERFDNAITIISKH